MSARVDAGQRSLPAGPVCSQAQMARFFEAGSGDLQTGRPERLTEYFHLA